jgi:hypothetical protein
MLVVRGNSPRASACSSPSLECGGWAHAATQSSMAISAEDFITAN